MINASSILCPTSFTFSHWKQKLDNNTMDPKGNIQFMYFSSVIRRFEPLYILCLNTPRKVYSRIFSDSKLKKNKQCLVLQIIQTKTSCELWQAHKPPIQKKPSTVLPSSTPAVKQELDFGSDPAVESIRNCTPRWSIHLPVRTHVW